MKQKGNLPLPGATDLPVCFTRFNGTVFLKEFRITPADECLQNACKGTEVGSVE